MTNQIRESFNWLAPEVFKTEDIGPNKVRVKGIALKSNIVSGNKRKYIDEELVKSARTLIKQPVNINHDSNRIIGNVEWAEYENGLLEYYMIINKQPYVEYFKNGSDNIKGVSVQADYLYNKCTLCGKRFFDETSFRNHMELDEHVKNNYVTEPHGIRFNGLSVVVSPEVPGVTGTTTELWETLQRSSALQLFEVVAQDKQEQEEWRLKMSDKAVITPEAHIAIGKGILPQKPAPLEINHEKLMENVKKDLGEPKKETEKSQDTLIPQVTLREIKSIPKLDLKVLESAPKLALGEPFANYKDFADCVAKNSDKDNPEAYCGTIKRQAEGETLFRKTTFETLNKIIEAISQPIEIPDFNPTLTQIREQLKGITETIVGLPKDDTSWKEHIEKHPQDDTTWKPTLESLTAKIATVEKTLPDIKTANEALQTLNTQFTEYKKQKDTESATKLKETQDLAQKLGEAEKKLQTTVERQDNLDNKLKGQFKAKTQIPTQTGESVVNPVG